MKTKDPGSIGMVLIILFFILIYSVLYLGAQ
jgi:hypothetical protein